MPGIGVSILSPTPNSAAGRVLQISGRIPAFNGSVQSVHVQFGVNSPALLAAGSGLAQHGISWIWNGNVPNEIRAGQAFTIIVTARGHMNIFNTGDPDPAVLEVSSVARVDVVLENVLPTVGIHPFRSPMVVRQLPHTFTLSGNASEGNRPSFGIALVEYRIGDGPFLNAEPSALHGWNLWSGPASVVSVGDTLITARATDLFGTVTTVQKSITVVLFSMSASVDPEPRKTLSDIPTTSSITSWTRLEPVCSGADFGLTSNARLFDPLWLITRQWQMGEFQAEDAGSPAQARVRATSAMLTRYHLGDVPANTSPPVALYDPARMPLETLVERRQMQQSDAAHPRMLPFSVEAGLHFLRMLELNASAKKYRSAFLTRYSLQRRDDVPAAADNTTLRFVQTMVGRAPDARLLATALRTSGGAPIVFESALNIQPADLGEVRRVAAAWLAWYDTAFSEPEADTADPWNPSRLEYAVSVSARMSADPQDEVTFSTRAFEGGRLDWSSFDLNFEVGMGTLDDRSFTSTTETTIPSPVSFRGMPAPRFWEMEDARIAYGLLPVGPTDLAQLLLIEYASAYGNDWYVVPLTVRVGSVTQVDSLVVTDTFGVRTLLRPIGDRALPKAHFSMWQHAPIRYSGNEIGSVVPNLFFLPPTLGRAQYGAALEDVLLMRDEMANMAWAIERSIENPIEQAARLYEAKGSLSSGKAGGPAPAPAPNVPVYLLSSNVPDNWIPLLPVLTKDGDATVSRLRRGAVLQPDGTQIIHAAQGQVLNSAPDLVLFDEEVPREGVRVTRQRALARWMDGSTWLWTGFHKQVGRGEGSSGLRFDRLLRDGDE